MFNIFLIFITIFYGINLKHLKGFSAPFNKLTIKNFQCLKTLGYSVFIQRGHALNGQIRNNDYNNLLTAKQGV